MQTFFALAGFQYKTFLAGGQAQHLDMLPHRRVEGPGETIDKADDLLFHHETVRRLPLIGVARQLALPIGRDQAETIPALLLPGVEYLLPLEHDMVQPGLRHVPGERKPGLAAADDRDIIMRVAHALNSRKVTASVPANFAASRSIIARLAAARAQG